MRNWTTMLVSAGLMTLWLCTISLAAVGSTGAGGGTVRTSPPEQGGPARPVSPTPVARPIGNGGTTAARPVTPPSSGTTNTSSNSSKATTTLAAPASRPDAAGGLPWVQVNAGLPAYSQSSAEQSKLAGTLDVGTQTATNAGGQAPISSKAASVTAVAISLDTGGSKTALVGDQSILKRFAGKQVEVLCKAAPSSSAGAMVVGWVRQAQPAAPVAPAVAGGALAVVTHTPPAAGAPPAAPAGPVDPEKAAADRLEQAKLYLDSGTPQMKADAQDLLTAIIKDYPDSKAAAEAKTLLAPPANQ